MKTLRDADIKGKIVLVRVDYNVPMQGNKIESDLRIRASIPTIKYLVEKGAKKIVLISHLGRPEGKVNPEFSLEPVMPELGKVLDEAGVKSTISFVSKTIGDTVKKAIAAAEDGSITLLENLRFDPREEENSKEFAQEIVDATGAEVFIQDGFAVVHRAHASTAAICSILPSYAGFLVEKEVSTLKSAIINPERPVLVIIGGAKVDDKAPLIKKFLPIADAIFVGGKIAADGYETKEKNIVVADDFVTDGNGEKKDIGKASTEKVLDFIKRSKTIIWNGTVGLTEEKPFDEASKAIAEAMGKRKDATTIVCGGDTTGYVESLQKENPDLEYSLVSTGGGASLELLSGMNLPGLMLYRPSFSLKNVVSPALIKFLGVSVLSFALSLLYWRVTYSRAFSDKTYPFGFFLSALTTLGLIVLYGTCCLARVIKNSPARKSILFTGLVYGLGLSLLFALPFLETAEFSVNLFYGTLVLFRVAFYVGVVTSIVLIVKSRKKKN